MPRQGDRGLPARLLRRLSTSAGELRNSLHVPAEVRQSLAGDMQHDLSSDEAADALSQAIICGSQITATFPDQWQRCRQWLLDQAALWERFALERIGSVAVPAFASGFAELTHLYEHLLHQEQPDRRKRAGVFYTPQPIVQYMLREIDAQLRDEFALPLGLADEATWGQLHQRLPAASLPQGVSAGEPFVKLFDPAVGTGAFLLEAIDFFHYAFTGGWRYDEDDDGPIADRWNDYVPRVLLPRLWGMELMAAPCLLTKLHVALKLAQTGFRFQSPARIEIHLVNTLAGPLPPLWFTRSASGSLWPLAERADHIAIPCDVPFTVVFGNPPFSYLSENQSDWITALVRGDNGHAGYLRADGQRLAEKKTWLHDDYVKFIRYAQWRIATTGCGIAALVTNHGYLTNATFRLMRQQLWNAFPRIAVLDLHGNRKAREISPDGSRDENVFGLDQGIAIGFFRRPPDDVQPGIEHAELWGTREAKFERLNAGQVFNRPIAPPGPVESLPHSGCSFAPVGGEFHPEYKSAPSLTDLLPGHASAPVTARDHFVVAFTRGELGERIEAFRDLSIPDDEIRGRYFTRTRSPRYSPGDTRSWKLPDARRALAALDDWESFAQPCQYRPLDWRWIFWHPAMIDWRRSEVTRHFNAECGARDAESQQTTPYSALRIPHWVALIARRQLPPTESATYFWATSALTLDGIIRNDNRGSESLFPISAEGLEMACYAYALFHSPSYRQRYVASLRNGFPRVLPAGDRQLTAEMTLLGRQLVELHTQRPPLMRGTFAANGSQRLLVTVAPRFPQYDGGRIWIRDDYAIAAANEAAWQFRIGAHQVARKWLADRRNRPLTEDDLAWYGVILATIDQTQTLAGEIDATIDRHGGFPAAFLAQA